MQMSVDDILEEIKQVDQSLGQRVFSTIGNTMNIEISHTSDGVNMDVSYKTQGRRKMLYKGVKETSLRKKIEEFLKEVPKDDSMSVACLVGQNKTMYGYTLRYFIIPILGYDIREGGVDFEEYSIDVSEEMYEVAKETSMAFFDEVERILYPIKKSALLAIGRYMDAMASYKVVSNIPLGNALLLSERLADDPKKFKLAYVDYDVAFRPVISVGVERTIMGDFYKMFEEYFSCCAKMGIYRVTKWDITVERVSVTMHMVMEDYYITFSTSNLPGETNRVKVTRMIGDVEVVFAEQSAYNTAQFSVNNLLEQAVLEYKSNTENFNISRLDQEFEITPEERKSLEKCYGSRRLNGIGDRFHGITDFLDKLDMELPPKQERQKNQAYMHVIKRLVS